MSLPQVRSEFVTEAELKITQPIMSSVRVFLHLQERRDMSIHSGQGTSTFVNVSLTGRHKILKTSRTQTAEESQGEDNHIVGRDSTSLNPLRLLSGFGQSSFMFSASAQVGTQWGHQALTLVFPPRTTSSLCRPPGPHHYGRPVLSPVIQLLTRTIHSFVEHRTPANPFQLPKTSPNRGRSIPRQIHTTPRRCVSSVPSRSIHTQSHSSARFRVNMYRSILDSSSFVKIPSPDR